MATANTKSTAVSNRDNRILTDGHLTKGVVLEAVGTVEVAAADDDTSVYRLGRLRSSDRLAQLLVANDAITGGTVFDFGLYRTAADGGAVVSVELFASNVDLSSAVAFRDLLYEATPTNIDKVEKRLWELLGLSADPQIDYDVCATGATVGSGAGTISAIMRYVAH